MLVVVVGGGGGGGGGPKLELIYYMCAKLNPFSQETQTTFNKIKSGINLEAVFSH